jgi:high-affinity iron transporter
LIAAAIIVLREVFEASLIIGIVLAATRGVPGRGHWIAGGIGLGVVGSIIVAGFAGQLASALEGAGQEVFNAGVLLAATAMLAWHNLWMKSHGAVLASDAKAVGRNITEGTAPLSMLLLVVGLAVLREGSEVVLFMYGVAAGGTDAAQMFFGGLLGLTAGIGIGAALYVGLLRIPARHLFTVTSWLLLLLAAGMAAQAAGYLVQAGKLPSLVDPVWDSSGWLPEHGLLGQVLHALVGYVDRPSAMQLIFFLAVLLTVGLAMKRLNSPPRVASSIAGGLGALVAAVATVLAPSPAHSAHVIYSPVVEEGELALEYRGHRDFDVAEDRDGAEQHKLEIEYAPLAFWLTALLGEWEKEPGASLGATEIAWENIWRSRVSERFEPGIEAHGEFSDWGNFGQPDDHKQELGPSLCGKIRRPGGHSALKYVASLLFGLTHDSPDSTLALRLEYEF